MPDVKSMGRKFRRLWLKEQKAAAERRQMGARLMAALKENGLTSVPVEADLIQLIIQKSRKVSKSRVVAYFGKDAAEEFWNLLPWKICEYVTVVTAGSPQPVGAASAECP